MPLLSNLDARQPSRPTPAIDRDRLHPQERRDLSHAEELSLHHCIHSRDRVTDRVTTVPTVSRPTVMCTIGYNGLDYWRHVSQCTPRC